MLWAVYEILFAVPLIAAGFIGWLVGHLRSVYPKIVVTVLTALLPLGYWFFLRAYRDSFFHLRFKDEAVEASVSASLMWVEMPVCLLIVVISAWAATRRQKRAVR